MEIFPLASTIISDIPPKTVRFNPVVRLVLIPTVTEYHTAGLTSILWWCGADYKGFKQSVFEEDTKSARLWIADLNEGGAKPRMLEGDGSVHGVAWSPVDDRIAISVSPTPQVDDEYMSQRIRVVSAADGKVLARVDNPGKMGAFAWSPDGKQIAMSTAADIHDPFAGRLGIVSADGGAPVQVLEADYDGDVTAFAWQSPQALMYAASHGTASSFEKVAVVGDHGGERKVLVTQDAGLVFTAVSLSRDGQHGAFVASRPEHPPELYTMSHGDGAATRRTDSNPWIKDMRFAKQEAVTHKARDGVELQGVLIRPLDEEKGRRYPLILCVHGGPESHESNGWLTNYARPGQMAAAKGFAVFYPNYRGSTGRGVAFSKLSQGDAAGKEFDDLVDAVDHLIASGLVDKDKVGITGGSYGGYATAWCSTRYTERFAAGVMFVGISNKLSKVGTTDIPNEEYYVHALKRPWEEWDFFLDRSPIRHAENARTPLLIMGGKDDTRVDPGQSKELYRWLKLRGKAPVRLVQYPGEGHGNRKACSRLDYCVRMMQWMEHYLTGPGGEMPAFDVTYPDVPESR